MNKNTKIKDRIRKTVSYVVLILVSIVFTASISPVSAYSCDPGDTECEEAKANMEAKRNEANLFSQKASSVSEIIEQLDEDIANLETSIAKNEKKIKQLNVKIKETEEKLEETKEALAEILVNMTQCRRFKRGDVELAYPETPIDEKCGFSLLINDIHSASVLIRFQTDSGRCEELSVPMSTGVVRTAKLRETIGKTLRFVRQNGLAALPK